MHEDKTGFWWIVVACIQVKQQVGFFFHKTRLGKNATAELRRGRGWFTQQINDEIMTKESMHHNPKMTHKIIPLSHKAAYNQKGHTKFLKHTKNQ